MERGAWQFTKSWTRLSRYTQPLWASLSTSPKWELRDIQCTDSHELLGRISNILHTKFLSHFLAHSKCLINDGWHISLQCTCFPETSCLRSRAFINFLIKKICIYKTKVILWKSIHWSPALCSILRETEMNKTWTSKNKSLVNMSMQVILHFAF